MKFVIGIGNPGKKYERTRHNIGFEGVDALAIRLEPDSFSVSQWKEKKELKSAVIETPGVLLIRPSTFVNESGQAAKAVANEHHANVKDFLVVCDDVNLDFGKLRLRESGSAGGHHGLESIIGALGSEEFARLRIGVGNQSMPPDLESFVLEKFSSEELKQTGKILERVSLISESWAKEGFQAALNRLSQLQSLKESS